MADFVIGHRETPDITNYIDPFGVWVAWSDFVHLFTGNSRFRYGAKEKRVDVYGCKQCF